MSNKKLPAYRIYNKLKQRYLTPEELAQTTINHEGTLMWASGKRAGTEVPEPDYVFERRFVGKEYEGDIHEEHVNGDLWRYVLENWSGGDDGPLFPMPGQYSVNMMEGKEESTFELEGGLSGKHIGNRMENPELLVYYDEEEDEWVFNCICRGGEVRGGTVNEMVTLMEEHYAKCYKRIIANDRDALKQRLINLAPNREEQEEDE